MSVEEIREALHVCVNDGHYPRHPVEDIAELLAKIDEQSATIEAQRQIIEARELCARLGDKYGSEDDNETR